MSKIVYALAAFLLVALANPAEARHHKYYHHHRHIARIAHTDSARCVFDNSGHQTCAGPIQSTSEAHRASRFASDGRCPVNLGCGCNLANYFHIGGSRWRDLWVARNWARIGSAASHGCINCVVVLSRGRGGHVGVVKGYDANGNPIAYSYANGRLGWTTATYSSRRVIAYRSI